MRPREKVKVARVVAREVAGTNLIVPSVPPCAHAV